MSCESILRNIAVHKGGNQAVGGKLLNSLICMERKRQRIGKEGVSFAFSVSQVFFCWSDAGLYP